MEKKISYRNKDIAKFYAGKSIFMTGATGFIGKVLMEKLLRSCPEIDKLYILIREKKGLKIEERLEKMFSLPLFDKLNEMNPTAIKKVIPISGDIKEKNLGMDPADRQVIIDNVSILIHNAANVRFDDSLQNAVLTNTRSIRDLCIMAESMKKLVVLLHISSAYAHCNIPVVEEITYESEVDWRDAIKVAENFDSYLLKILTSKYMDKTPNTYTFSKKLAENVVTYYSDRLPCVICRPSIVVSTAEDPLPGWIDNLNGPVGLMIVTGIGISRINYANTKTLMDFIPVDYAAKAFIIAMYTRGKKTVQQCPTPIVYNVSSYKIKRFSMDFVAKCSLEYVEINPLPISMYYPNITMTKCFFYYYIYFMLFQILPAIFIDQIIKFTGRKPILVKLGRKIYLGSIFLFYFTEYKWDFINYKLLDVINSIPDDDKADFSFDTKFFNERNVINNAIKGATKYLLNDPGDEEAKRRGYNRSYYLYIAFNTVWYMFLFWFVLRMLKWI